MRAVASRSHSPGISIPTSETLPVDLKSVAIGCVRVHRGHCVGSDEEVNYRTAPIANAVRRHMRLLSATAPDSACGRTIYGERRVSYTGAFRKRPLTPRTPNCSTAFARLWRT